MVALLWLLGWCGCGGPRADYRTVTLVPAYGKITLDGQPLADAVVTFEAPDGQFSFALTDAAGKYQLRFDSDAKGVSPGPKTVRISTARKIAGLNAEGDGGDGEGDPVGNAEKVPAKYNRQSQLTVEVTKNQTEYNFDLTSK